MRTAVTALILCAMPGVSFAEQTPHNPLFHLDLTQHWVGYLSLAIMVAAYIAAMFEETTELRKSKPMLLAATLIWFLIVLAYRMQGDGAPAVAAFRGNLQAYIELLLFIMVSMTYLVLELKPLEATNNKLFRQIICIEDFQKSEEFVRVQKRPSISR